MCIETIHNIQTAIDQKVAEWCKPIGEFFDANPTVYKVCTVVLHFFRAGGMYALMSFSPFGFIPTAAAMFGLSFLYLAAAEERGCPWKFTLLSTAGALAMYATQSSLICVIAKTALTPFSSLTTALGFACLPLYTLLASYRAHYDVEAYLEKKGKMAGRSKGCCEL